MSKTYVAARPKAVIEIFRRLAPGSIIEIYQDVAAEDQVEFAVSRHVLSVDQIGAGEFDRAPQSLVDLMSRDSRISARSPYMPSAAALSALVSISDPRISTL